MASSPVQTRPPTLTRRILLIHLKKTLPHFPAEVLRAGLEEIIACLADSLVRGGPVILRGFGRFQLRRYQNSTKTVGVVFRPSPGLFSRLNSGQSPPPTPRRRPV
ncbi:hypothetical protein C4J81_14180 [Deltaproteobacteria bacterium Smac51]|nr:hypothetical protein C4J81_14180 [Deltaproteobacteria bacterium Smac51]